MDSSVLSSIPMLAAMPPRAREAVASMMDERSFPDGAILLRQGERLGGVFILLSGHVRVERHLPAGGTVDLATLGPGAALGTLAALDGGPRGASAIARGPVHSAVLPRGAFMELMDGRTPVALGFQLAVVRDLLRDVRATNRRLVELASLPDQSLSLEELTDRLYGAN
jgi:CRP/FNR family transcriptional regulator, cyclic AMP receptor protein